MKTNKSLLQFRWPPNPRTTCSTISNNSQQIFTRSLLGFFAFRVSSFFRGFYYFFQSCLITLPHPHAVTCTVRHVSFRRGQKRAVWGRLAPESRDYCCTTTIVYTLDDWRKKRRFFRFKKRVKEKYLRCLL